MKSFCHPNIVEINEVFVTKSNKLNIVMKYVDGMDLENFVLRQKNIGYLDEQ